MKRYGWGCLAAVLFVAFCICADLIVFLEIPLVLLFGWTVFLIRTAPKMTAEPAAIAVGVAAFAAAVAVGHRLGGWLWQARRSEGETPARPWRFRWALSIAFIILFAFAAGIGMIATVHQVAWLFTSREPMTESSFKASRRSYSGNNLRQIGLGTFSYHDTYRRFPPGGTFDCYGEGMHSWETMLLPYLENPARPNLGLPWNHPENKQHFTKEVNLFLNLAMRRDEHADNRGYALSHYALNIHVARANVGLREEDVTNGLSNTLMAGEVNGHFKPWGDPVNWRNPSLGINRSPDGFGGGKGYGGAQFLMMDGSVRFLNETTNPEVLKALSIPAGGEKVHEYGSSGSRCEMRQLQDGL